VKVYGRLRGGARLRPIYAGLAAAGASRETVVAARSSLAAAVPASLPSVLPSAAAAAAAVIWLEPVSSGAE